MNWFIMRWTHVKYPTNSLLAGSSKASNSSSCCITRNRLTLTIANKMGEYSSGSHQPFSLTPRTASAYMSTLSYSFRVIRYRRSARQNGRHVRCTSVNGFSIPFSLPSRLRFPLFPSLSSSFLSLSLLGVCSVTIFSASWTNACHVRAWPAVNSYATVTATATTADTAGLAF
jgi:hypothetical protein